MLCLHMLGIIFVVLAFDCHPGPTNCMQLLWIDVAIWHQQAKIAHTVPRIGSKNERHLLSYHLSVSAMALCMIKNAQRQRRTGNGTGSQESNPHIQTPRHQLLVQAVCQTDVLR